MPLIRGTSVDLRHTGTKFGMESVMNVLTIFYFYHFFFNCEKLLAERSGKGS